MARSRSPAACPSRSSDFQITAPNVGGFIVSIADEGALEFVVVFAKA